MKDRERDVQISILQCLAIIFVVVGHRGGINLLNEWFPINSFHMPLWFFISGYLYKVDESGFLSLISTDCTVYNRDYEEIEFQYGG